MGVRWWYRVEVLEGLEISLKTTSKDEICRRQSNYLKDLIGDEGKTDVANCTMELDKKKWWTRLTSIMVNPLWDNTYTGTAY